MLSVTLFSTNYNKTHKSRLKNKIKDDLYKISPKNLKKTYVFEEPFSSPAHNAGV